MPASTFSFFEMLLTVLRNEKPTSPANARASASSAGAIQRGVPRLRQKSSFSAFMETCSLGTCKGELLVVERVEAEVLVFGGFKGTLRADDHARARLFQAEESAFALDQLAQAFAPRGITSTAPDGD